VCLSELPMHCKCETQRDGQAELLTVSVVAVSVSVRTAYALYVRDIEGWPG